MRSKNGISCIFFGSKPGAIVALEILIYQGFEVLFVILNKHISDNQHKEELYRKLVKNNIKVCLQSELPKSLKVDYIFSYMYRYKIKDDVLKMAKRASLNFHPSPLPKYAGYGGYNRAILNEDNKFAATCHHIISTYDEGPIALKREFDIDSKNINAFELERITQVEMIKLFIKIISMINQEIDIPFHVQNIYEREWIERKELDSLRKIPKGSNIEEIEKYVRAFWFPPYPGAYIDYNNIEIEIVTKSIKQYVLNKNIDDKYFEIKKAAENFLKELII